MASPRRYSTTTPLVLTLVILGACNGGVDAPGPSTTSAPDADARARAVNLTLDDLSPGFVVARQETERSDGGLEACVPGFTADAVAEAESPVFQSPAGPGRIFVTSNTAVLASEEQATRLLDVLRQSAAVSCLRDAIAAGLVDTSEGGTVQRTSLVEADDVPPFGEQRAVLAGSVTFTAPGVEQPVELTYSLVLVRTNEIVSLLLYGGLIEAFPPSTVVELTEVVAGRQQAA